MQLSWSAHIIFRLFALTAVALSSYPFSFIAEHDETTTNLETRQVTGVIATSQFLRRAYQACKQLSMECSKHADIN